MDGVRDKSEDGGREFEYWSEALAVPLRLTGCTRLPLRWRRRREV